MEQVRPDAIVARECASLDRWGKGDPHGYLESFDDDITYFDPLQEQRIDGLAAMADLLVPLTGKIRVDRYEMLRPMVQASADIAVLTFNLVSYRTDDGVERAISRWNATEIYRRRGTEWKLFHSHWSFIKPELKAAITETV